MEKSKKQWVNILRWLIIIPVTIFVYLVSKFIYSFIANIFVSELLSNIFNSFSSNSKISYDYIYQINNSQDFAGHYIIGTIYIFSREIIGVYFAIFSGIYFAPSYKKQVGFSLIILLIMSSVLLSVFIAKTSDQFLYTNETIIRMIFEYLGMITGTYFAWRILLKR